MAQGTAEGCCHLDHAWWCCCAGGANCLNSEMLQTLRQQVWQTARVRRRSENRKTNFRSVCTISRGNNPLLQWEWPIIRQQIARKNIQIKGRFFSAAIHGICEYQHLWTKPSGIQRSEDKEHYLKANPTRWQFWLQKELLATILPPILVRHNQESSDIWRKLCYRKETKTDNQDKERKYKKKIDDTEDQSEALISE